ncbi:MAG TPA: hypothetical protein VFF68_03060 [Anaerolineaceae bacterium]|nr:hypothetical protein [Anaerolineaceae bacterium]
MAVYATYSFYTETYQGTAIAQTDFDRLAARASILIDTVCFGQAAAVVAAAADAETIAKIGNATCEIAEALHRDETEGGEIQSERVGNHSVTYVTGQARALIARAREEAKPWLWDTGLMYGGLS